MDQKRLEEIRQRHEAVTKEWGGIEGGTRSIQAHHDRGWLLAAIAEAQEAEQQAHLMRAEVPRLTEARFGMSRKTYDAISEIVSAAGPLGEVTDPAVRRFHSATLRLIASLGPGDPSSIAVKLAHALDVTSGTSRKDVRELLVAALVLRLAAGQNVLNGLPEPLADVLRKARASR